MLARSNQTLTARASSADALIEGASGSLAKLIGGAHAAGGSVVRIIDAVLEPAEPEPVCTPAKCDGSNLRLGGEQVSSILQAGVAPDELETVLSCHYSFSNPSAERECCCDARCE